MLSIKVLVGLMSLIAHHFLVIISRSPRLDCSLALAQGTVDSGGGMTAPMQQSFLLIPLSSTSPGCLGHQYPVGTAVSGVSQWKGVKTHATTKGKGEEMFRHSPASSFPLCCPGTAEGWH